METTGFTPEDILDLAVRMEKNRAEFYQRAARIAEAFRHSDDQVGA